MSCRLFQSHVIYILFPFQDPQNDEYSAPKRCRLATKKRPAYEPASGGPFPKRSAPCAGEELEWSPTDEEEYLNISGWPNHPAYLREAVCGRKPPPPSFQTGDRCLEASLVRKLNIKVK